MFSKTFLKLLNYLEKKYLVDVAEEMLEHVNSTYIKPTVNGNETCVYGFYMLTKTEESVKLNQKLCSLSSYTIEVLSRR